MNRELQGNDETLDKDLKSTLVELTRRKELVIPLFQTIP